MALSPETRRENNDENLVDQELPPSVEELDSRPQPLKVEKKKKDGKNLKRKGSSGHYGMAA